MARLSPKKIRELPAKDVCWVRFVDRDRCGWFVTSKPDRSAYFLYRLTPDGYELISKAATPVGFSDIVFPPE